VTDIRWMRTWPTTLSSSITLLSPATGQLQPATQKLGADAVIRLQQGRIQAPFAGVWQCMDHCGQHMLLTQPRGLCLRFQLAPWWRHKFGQGIQMHAQHGDTVAQGAELFSLDLSFAALHQQVPLVYLAIARHPAFQSLSARSGYVAALTDPLLIVELPPARPRNP